MNYLIALIIIGALIILFLFRSALRQKQIEEWIIYILRENDEMGGVELAEEIEAVLGRRVSTGSLYVALHRLSEQNLVTYREGEATAIRGGLRKRYYRLK